jgi:hypothetical protein
MHYRPSCGTCDPAPERHEIKVEDVDRTYLSEMRKPEKEGARVDILEGLHQE